MKFNKHLSVDCGNGVCKGVETFENCLEDCKKSICNFNGICEGIENQNNCFNDCEGLAISPELRESIYNNFQNRKNYYDGRLIVKDTQYLYAFQAAVFVSYHLP